MRELNGGNFGLVIAYLLPGYVALWGVGLFSETVSGWLGGPGFTEPTIGGFLHGTLASLAAGMIVSTIRWAVVDRIHHRTGIAEPDWDFRDLQRRFVAFEGLVQNHYRYYQAHANLFVAVAVSGIAMLARSSWNWTTTVGLLLVAAVEVVLWFGSRDTLKKYYRRTENLLSERSARG